MWLRQGGAPPHRLIQEGSGVLLEWNSRKERTHGSHSGCSPGRPERWPVLPPPVCRAQPVRPGKEGERALVLGDEGLHHSTCQ